MKCFLDLETEPLENVTEFLQKPTAPANYKDPDKIAAYIEKKQRDQIARAALDFDLGRITAGAIRMGVDGRTHGWVVSDKFSEEKLIKNIWRAIDICRGKIVGYNIIGFDLPYLIRRSFALEIAPWLYLDLRKYQVRPIVDLMQILAFWERDKVRGLKFICKRYGIDNPLPDLDGSQYADMDYETRLAYVKNDVDLLVALYKRMAGYYDF